MTDQPKDAFTIWGNFNKNRDKDGHYWAKMEIPLSEIASLVTWAKNAERCQNQKGEDCVQLRANLMPRISSAGNEYLLMAMSDAKPKVDDAPF
ncbi:MAG: hypothetical protein DWQ28_08375 [Proteobacteria bacterium]|nr:MAG: hypothetical protein DWQ28_08375 [Pseudomonadota bacterium]